MKSVEITVKVKVPPGDSCFFSSKDISSLRSSYCKHFTSWTEREGKVDLYCRLFFTGLEASDMDVPAKCPECLSEVQKVEAAKINKMRQDKDMKRRKELREWGIKDRWI